MIRWADVRREPFRLLFPLGILFGCLGIGHWLVYALGWLPAGSGFFHASIQIGSYMACFILGFLMTALPRFSNTEPCANWELLLVLAALGMQLVLLTRGQWVAAQGCVAALFVLLVVFAARRFIRRRAEVGPPTEFVWIPTAAVLGVVGTALLIAGQLRLAPAWVLGLGRPMLQQGFVLAIVLGIGGFLAPRLMGVPTLLITPSGVAAEEARRIRRRRVLLHASAGAVLSATFVLEGRGLLHAAYLLRAAVVTAEFLWTTRCYRRPRTADEYVQWVWRSLWMILLGLWGAGMTTRYRVAMLHFVFLGGFSLMTFAVGTMVVLSHSGEGRRLREPLWIFRVVGFGIAGAVVARVLADLWPSAHTPWLGVASACWLAAGISWLAFIRPFVLRAPPREAFEQLHEESKRRLLKSVV